jgi:3-hydroxyisobutyrate dehydrogenase
MNKNMQRSSVALIGVGNMGGGMARRLLSQGYIVHVLDIDSAKTEALAKLGAFVHASPSSFPADCKVVIICVVDSLQIESILPTLFTMPPVPDLPASPATHTPARAVLLCPTIAPEDTERFTASLNQHGFQAIDAPMSGGPQRAAEGTMSLMVACPEEVFAAHEVLLRDLSNQVFHDSERVGDGARMKLCNNLLAGINLAGAAQVMALAQTMGLDTRQALTVMQSSSAQSWIGQDRMSRALEGDYAPRAHMTLLAKDTQLALTMAAKAGADCSVGISASQAFVNAVSGGYADLDDGALLAFFNAKQA